MKETLKCLVKTLSPLHIGCDEVYEPLSFVVDEQRQEMVFFDPLAFFGEMEEEEKKRFSMICQEGTLSSILELYKFMRNRKTQGRTIRLCPGFLEHYQATLSISTKDTKRIQQEINRFSISRTSYRPADGRAYIPGSVIKGALRTAYLNRQAAIERLPAPPGNAPAQQLEKALLHGGVMETDPFRMVKVSDFQPVGDVKTAIVYAVNEKKTLSNYEARGPYQILEVVDPGSLFEGSLTVEPPEPQAKIRTPIVLKDLLESAIIFYNAEKKREDKELVAIGVIPVPDPVGRENHLIRLGRHSGAECVTIDGYRKIKIMTGRGQRPRAPSDHATTVWLASLVRKPKVKKALSPFGWAVLSVPDDEVLKSIHEREQEWRESYLSLSSTSQRLCGKTYSSEKDGLKTIGSQKRETTPSKKTPERCTWENAVLTYKANEGSIKASLAGKSATTRDRTLVPERLRKKLFEKGKEVTATVELEKYGNEYKIVRIE